MATHWLLRKSVQDPDPYDVENVNMILYDESVEIVEEVLGSGNVPSTNCPLPESHTTPSSTGRNDSLIPQPSVTIMMKEESEIKSKLKKEGSSSLEPMDPLKFKTGLDKRVTTKKVDRSGQEPSDDEEEDDEEESEYQSNRFAQIEGLRKMKLRALGRMQEGLNEDEDEEELSFTDLEDDEFSKMAYDEMTHRLAVNTMTNNTLRIDKHPTTKKPSVCSSTTEDSELEQMQKQVHETELEIKRNELAYIAKYTCNPGIHRAGYRMYRPEDYEQLNTTPEIKELFEYITMYAPPQGSSQVDVKLKPFIPEFYPSVGDIDAFLKVIHPEIGNDSLGIKMLDEPCAFQSDPSVLDLRLRAMAKQSSATAVVVKKVENVGKNSKVIDNWIKDISDLHRSKPSPSVHYSKPMPDIDQLLQEWPQGFETLLTSAKLPPPELDCDLKTYIDIVCSLLDIPVYKSRIQSLHVLASLYLAYKSFGNYAIGGAGGGAASGKLKREYGDGATHEDGVDRLELE